MGLWEGAFCAGIRDGLFEIEGQHTSKFSGPPYEQSVPFAVAAAAIYSSDFCLQIINML